MNPYQEQVLVARLLPPHRGFAGPAEDALSDTAPIQALIDATDAGTATKDDAGAAQSALTGVIGDLNSLSASGASAKMSTTTSMVIGFGAGLIVAAVAYLYADSKPARRSTRSRSIRRRYS